jgi:hypothetical protein
VARELDEKLWLHVSCARQNGLPSYDDLKRIKHVLVGSDRTVLQVFPPADKHVNIHKHCLHLFCCLGGNVTPDFTHGSGSL